MFIARQGHFELTTTILSEGQVRDLVEKMLKTTGRRVDLSTPFVQPAPTCASPSETRIDPRRSTRTDLRRDAPRQHEFHVRPVGCLLPPRTSEHGGGPGGRLGRAVGDEPGLARAEELDEVVLTVFLTNPDVAVVR